MLFPAPWRIRAEFAVSTTAAAAPDVKCVALCSSRLHAKLLTSAPGHSQLRWTVGRDAESLAATPAARSRARVGESCVRLRATASSRRCPHRSAHPSTRSATAGGAEGA